MVATMVVQRPKERAVEVEAQMRLFEVAKVLEEEVRLGSTAFVPASSWRS